MIRAAAGLVIACLAVATQAMDAQEVHPHTGLRLPRVFSDGMVVQRDVRIPVWGWSAPGVVVQVALDSASVRATADANGHWAVSFAALPAGGPHALTIRDAATRLEVRDIFAGDVWVASGQSNMEWPVRDAENARDAIASANDPLVRHFGVPHTFAEQPTEDVAGGSWSRADSAHVGQFTAVGYFFAREVRRTVDVPIGLLHASWGGSNIETWMSRDALGMSTAEWQKVIAAERTRSESMRAALQARLGTLPVTDSGLVNAHAVWAAPDLDETGWSPVNVPSLWEQQGYDGMDGVAWYRVAVTLTAEESGAPAHLSLGTIDDNDITWINGVEVGRTNGYSLGRRYDVKASALRPGKNVITVRVSDGGGGGGLYGDPANVYVQTSSRRVALAGTWRFKVGRAEFGNDGQRINKVPTVLHNAMLAPLQRFPIKGVLWYQGESNANNDEQARAYASLFQGLIRSWRSDWAGRVGDFPFLWVQLPNFNRPDSVPPARSAWATHRESMTSALSLPNTGQAITIDLGDAGDIHPRNKLDVGKRLAWVALKSVYHQDVVASGPTYRTHMITDGRVSIEFDNVGGGLISRRNDGRVGGFAIAGPDQKLVRADARIDGNRVIVWSSRVPNPVAVRYAWSDNPAEASLYNRDGLPTAPFRTDKW